MKADTRGDDGSNGDASRRRLLQTVGGALTGAALVNEATKGASARGSTTEPAGTYTGEEYDGRYYGKYVPSSYDGSDSVPLVMLLHGCTQTADGFKDETGFNEVAEEHGVIAIYPEETEGTYGCWNWFEDAHTLRGQGQAKELAEGIVDQVAANQAIDRDRVYLAGFSAGAYMVPNLVVEYADVFAAGAIHSGGIYDVAESQFEGNGVISDSSCDTGSSPDPEVEGEHAYDRMVQHGIDDHHVPTVVFHGIDDTTVYPCHGEGAAEQATVTNDLLDDDTDDGSVDYTADETNTGSGSSLTYTEYEYHDATGDSLVEHYVVDGMGHAWSGGTSGGSYTAPGGPDASSIIWSFFASWTNSLNDAPTASATASTDVASIGETVEFDATNSSDSDGSIATYEWDVDGDGSVDATGATATHSYDAAGTYTATMTVTDDAGATDTASVDVQVCDGNCPPMAELSASETTVTTKDTVSFDASGSADVDGSIVSYEWDVDDDGTVDASGETATYSYDSTGTFTATVTVTDDDGATDSASVAITVESPLYCGEAENGTHVDVGRAYDSWGCYYAEGSDQYMGSCISTNLTVLEETSTGYFEVVDSCPDDGDGGDGGNTAPTAAVSADKTTVDTGETVSFDASDSTDDDGSIANYDWDFQDDGSVDASGETATYSYDSTGTYTTTVTVTDDDGATDSATVEVTVEDASQYCGEAGNQVHVDEGRASTWGGCYYAEGSGQYMGSCISTSRTVLAETSPDYYEVVDSC